MNPARLIIRDYLLRRWWVWVMVLPVSLYFIGVACLLHDHLHPRTSNIPFIFFLGSFLMVMDLGRGSARILLNLPISARELARIWRWEALGLPFMISTLFNYLGFLIYCLFKGSWNLFPLFTLYNLGNLLVLGVLYFVLTGLPAAQQQGATPFEQAKAALFGFLWGGGFMGIYFFAMWGDASSPLGRLLIAIAVILTVWGWFRADLLVQRRAGFGLAVQKGGETREDSRCAEGGGGLLFLMQLLISRMVITGFSMLVLFGVIIAFKASYFMAHMEPELHDHLATFLIGNPFISMMFSLTVAIQIMPFCLQMRFLRTLPCSANKLAALMIFTPLLGLLTLFVCLALVLAAFFHQSVLSLLLSVHGWPCVFMLFFVPLVVWMGWGLVLYFGLVLLATAMTVYSTIGSILHWPLIPSLSLALSLLLVPVAFLLTKFAIERSSRTYRLRLNPFSGGSWGGGR